jgi:phenylalanyl-tRNA synthetase beta chain
MGIVSKKFQTKFEIDNPVYYADFWFDAVLDHQQKHSVSFSELPKFPAVRRDLALLIDKNVTFQQIKDAAFKAERKILKDVGLFDVYEGKGIPEDKKSYAVKFTLRDESRTLKDKQIDKTMKKLLTAFERELGAQLRG